MRFALMIESIAREQWEKGRIGTHDYLEARCVRLEHQAELAHLDPVKRRGPVVTTAEVTTTRASRATRTRPRPTRGR